MKLIRPLLLASMALLLLTAQGAGAEADATGALRLDELRVKGSHNSYHKHPLLAVHPRHRYEHDSLFVQLEYHGVRALELDLHLGSDGYEVYHIRFIDGRSHCRLLLECLAQIRSWSDLDRDHEPLMIWLEAKDFAGGERMPSLRPVDAVLRRAFGDRLLTPDDVRGAHDSLRAAIMSEGWPSLAESRGKVLFMLTASDAQRVEYTSGFKHLRGRSMFVEAKWGQYRQPWAAVTKVYRSHEMLMDEARPQRMLVTTTTCTADVDDVTCAWNRRRALENGANILLDDYVRVTPGRLYHLDLGKEAVAGIATSEPSTPAAAVLEPGS
jgi:hypothetical protein